MQPLTLVPTEANHRSILLYSDAGFAQPLQEGFSWTPTPLACLNAATERPYDVIVLYITGPSSFRGDPLIELCAVLKQNSHTRTAVVLAVCAARSRVTVERLKTAGADFVVFGKDMQKSGQPDDPVYPLDQLTEENRPERVLSRLCPHLHYSPTQAGGELTTCGACSNWLVLGPRRLRGLCEIPSHTECPHFKNPRFQK